MYSRSTLLRDGDGGKGTGDVPRLLHSQLLGVIVPKETYFKSAFGIQPVFQEDAVFSLSNNNSTVPRDALPQDEWRTSSRNTCYQENKKRIARKRDTMVRASGVRWTNNGSWKVKDPKKTHGHGDLELKESDIAEIEKMYRWNMHCAFAETEPIHSVVDI